MLLTPQLESYPLRLLNTLYMERCQFNYKIYDI